MCSRCLLTVWAHAEDVGDVAVGLSLGQPGQHLGRGGSVRRGSDAMNWWLRPRVAVRAAASSPASRCPCCAPKVEDRSGFARPGCCRRRARPAAPQRQVAAALVVLEGQQPHRRLRRSPCDTAQRVHEHHAQASHIDCVARHAGDACIACMGVQARKHLLCSQRLDDIVDSTAREALDDVCRLRQPGHGQPPAHAPRPAFA